MTHHRSCKLKLIFLLNSTKKKIEYALKIISGEYVYIYRERYIFSFFPFSLFFHFTQTTKKKRMNWNSIVLKNLLYHRKFLITDSFWIVDSAVCAKNRPSERFLAPMVRTAHKLPFSIPLSIKISFYYYLNLYFVQR